MIGFDVLVVALLFVNPARCHCDLATSGSPVLLVSVLKVLVIHGNSAPLGRSASSGCTAPLKTGSADSHPGRPFAGESAR